MAAEAEHVGPGPEPEIFQLLAGTERPGGADQPAGPVSSTCSEIPSMSATRARAVTGSMRFDRPLKFLAELAQLDISDHGGVYDDGYAREMPARLIP